jgi:hypothetical protein
LGSLYLAPVSLFECRVFVCRIGLRASAEQEQQHGFPRYQDIVDMRRHTYNMSWLAPLTDDSEFHLYYDI